MLLGATKINYPIIIQHRASLDGISIHKPQTNNEIEHEIDIWYYKKTLLYGHEFKNTEQIGVKSLPKSKLWIHCKNLEAYVYLSSLGYQNIFMQDKDPVAVINDTRFKSPTLWLNTYESYRIVSEKGIIPDNVVLLFFGIKRFPWEEYLEYVTQARAICVDYSATIKYEIDTWIDNQNALLKQSSST